MFANFGINFGLLADAKTISNTLRALAGATRTTGNLSSIVTCRGCRAADASCRETRWIVRSSQHLTELIGLGILSEDRHVHVPRRTGPLGPDAMILVFAAGVGMNEEVELTAILNEPRNHGIVVMHRHKCTWKTRRKNI